MVKKTCFIDRCYTGNNEKNGPAKFFSPPKNHYEEWRNLIPKKGFLPTSRLCWRHFDEQDIAKGRLIGDTFYPQEKWRLVSGALPKHHLDTMGKFPTCYVPSCKVKHTSYQGFFRPPKDEETRKLWDRAIGRTDKKLTEDCKVCQKHFAEGDIVKALVLIIGDKTEVHPYKHWRLKNGAVPSIFPESAQNAEKRRGSADDMIIDRAPANKRRNCDDGDSGSQQQPHFVDLSSADEPIQNEVFPILRTECNPSAVENEPSLQCNYEFENCAPIHTTEELADDSVQVIECDMLDLNPRSAKLPDKSWSWNSFIRQLSDTPNQTGGHLTCLKIGIHSDELKVIKALQIGRSQQLSYVVLGRLVRPRSFPFEFDSVDGLTEILARFEAAPLCPGVSDVDLLERVASHVSGFKTARAWFSATCCGMIENALGETAAFCESCGTLRTALRKQLKVKGTSKSILMAQKARESEEMSKKVARRDKKIKKMMEEINRLRGSLSMDATAESIDSSSDEE